MSAGRRFHLVSAREIPGIKSNTIAPSPKPAYQRTVQLEMPWPVCWELANAAMRQIAFLESLNPNAMLPEAISVLAAIERTKQGEAILRSVLRMEEEL